MAAFHLEGIVGCPCRNEDKFRHVLADPLSVLTTLHSVKHILNKEECRSVAKNRFWWDGLALVLSAKPPVVVQEILGMLEKYHEKRWYGDATNAIKLLSNMYQDKLVDEDDIEWMKGKDGYLPDRVIHLQCSKHPEMMTRSANALGMFGYYDSANQLRELNELSSRHLLTPEECSEVAVKRWMWTDRLAKVLLTKPTEIQQAATQVLDYYVKEELKRIIQTHRLLSDPRYRSSTSLFDLRNRGATPLSSDFGYGTSTTPSSVSRYGSLATLSSDMTHESSPPSSSDSRSGSSTTLPSDWQYRGSTALHGDLQVRSVFLANSRYKGSTTAATSTHSSSSLVKRYQKKPLHPHDEGPFLSVQKLSLEKDAEEATSQGTKVHSQPAGGGSDPPKAPENVSVHDAEAALIDLCWIPLGIQLQSIGTEGGKLSLASSGGAMGGEEEMTFFLEVPPGAVKPSERIDIHYAAIPYGPFTLPEGYQFGSMVVYVYYDSRHVRCPLRLLLPHWCGEEDQDQSGLTFAMAPHTLNKGEHVYHFQLLEGRRRVGSHCGELEIDGHCSLFSQVFKKGVMSRYQALSLQREQGNEMTCDVAVTYAFPLWCKILTKYRNGWKFDKCSSSFTFGENGLKGTLKKERGNGWQAGIKGSHELKPYDVEYGSLGITTAKMLKMAVLSKGYPPAITLAVTYREDLRKKGNPVWVGMEIMGADAGKELTFMCKAYEEVHCQQLNGSMNAATDSHTPLSPPPNMEATTPPFTESDSPQGAAGGRAANDILSKEVYEHPEYLSLMRKNVSKAAGTQGKAVLEELGLKEVTITSCFQNNPLNSEEAVQGGLVKWSGGHAKKSPTWSVLLKAMEDAGIDKKYTKNLKRRLGLSV